MWLLRSDFYVLADQNGSPLLVKFADEVSYMPVFETKKEAASAAKSFAATYNEALEKTKHSYTPLPFTWERFKKSQAHAKTFGHMLFVYPMVPNEYSSTFQTHAL